MNDQKIIYDGKSESSSLAPCAVVIFGASGDLTKRKLIPAFFRLFQDNKLPENFYIIGFARSKMDDKAFQKIVEDILKNKGESTKEVKPFAEKCFYFSGKYDDIESFKELKKTTDILNKKYSTQGNMIFQLSTPPFLYSPVVEMLSKSKLLIKNQTSSPYSRVIFEKPFGRDYKSAVELNDNISKHATDNQVYRIDHYLGKDTVQNIFVFRFANSIFERVWNRDNIDHVQITLSEDIGIGSRAGYFDQTGLIRDMLQNHLLQLLCYVAMEPPVNLVEDSIRNEKSKILNSITAFDLDKLEENLILGQYDYSSVDGKEEISYRNEENIPQNSFTETYFATKLFVGNWRWEGVPFYLRCGKRLKEKCSKISVVFKKAPKSVFSNFHISDHLYNVITFNIYPEQGVSLRFQAKLPGSKMTLGSLKMDFNYKSQFGKELTADYDSLLLDCMLGDQALFMRKDAVETSWKIITPILEKIESYSDEEKRDLVHQYVSGSYGPKAADDFIKKDNRSWIE